MMNMGVNRMVRRGSLRGVIANFEGKVNLAVGAKLAGTVNHEMGVSHTDLGRSRRNLAAKTDVCIQVNWLARETS
jgi:hypothetical protein